VLNSYSSLHSTLVGAEATESVLDDDAQSRDLDAVLKSGRNGGYLIVTSKADRGGKVALTRHQGIASRRVGRAGDDDVEPRWPQPDT
jgi:hypothetical protein